MASDVFNSMVNLTDHKDFVTDSALQAILKRGFQGSYGHYEFEIKTAAPYAATATQLYLKINDTTDLSTNDKFNVRYIGTKSGSPVNLLWLQLQTETLSDNSKALKLTSANLNSGTHVIGSGASQFSLSADVTETNFRITRNENIDSPAIATEDRSLRTASYQWILSTSGTTEYYVQFTGGNNPLLIQPNSVTINGSAATEGTVGSLAAGEWDYGNNDSLAYSTLYVRLSDGTDPDTKAADYIVANLDVRSLPRWTDPHWAEHGAIGDGTTDDFGALDSADTAAGANGVIYLQTGKTYDIQSNLTLDAFVIIDNGAQLKSSNGSTLTINKGIAAGPYQIFQGGSGGLDVTFGDGAVERVYLEWWGGKTSTAATDPGAGNYSSDALNDAIDALPNGGVIELLEGWYHFDTSVTINAPRISLIGRGADTTRLRAADAFTVTDPLFKVRETRATFEYLQVHCGGFASAGIQVGEQQTGANPSGYSSSYCNIKHVDFVGAIDANLRHERGNFFNYQQIRVDGSTAGIGFLMKSGGNCNGGVVLGMICNANNIGFKTESYTEDPIDNTDVDRTSHGSRYEMITCDANTSESWQVGTKRCWYSFRSEDVDFSLIAGAHSNIIYEFQRAITNLTDNSGENTNVVIGLRGKYLVHQNLVWEGSYRDNVTALEAATDLTVNANFFHLTGDSDGSTVRRLSLDTGATGAQKGHIAVLVHDSGFYGNVLVSSEEHADNELIDDRSEITLEPGSSLAVVRSDKASDGQATLDAQTTAFTQATSSGGSVDDGIHYYKLVNVEESGGVAQQFGVHSGLKAGITVTSPNSTVDLASIPQAVDGVTTHIYIYRTKAGASQIFGPYHFVGKVTLGTTTFADTIADASLPQTVTAGYEQVPVFGEKTWHAISPVLHLGHIVDAVTAHSLALTDVNGTASITSGNTSVVVAHGFGATPGADQIQITPTSSFGSAVSWWVDTIDGTNFTINLNTDPVATVTFSWRVLSDLSYASHESALDALGTKINEILTRLENALISKTA